MRLTCCGSSPSTSPTTMKREATCRSTATRRSLVRSSNRVRAASSRSHTSAGCFTGTRGRPEAAMPSHRLLRICGTRKLRARVTETVIPEPFGTAIGTARPSPPPRPAHHPPLQPRRMTFSVWTTRRIKALRSKHLRFARFPRALRGIMRKPPRTGERPDEKKTSFARADRGAMMLVLRSL